MAGWVYEESACQDTHWAHRYSLRLNFRKKSQFQKEGSYCALHWEDLGCRTGLLCALLTSVVRAAYPVKLHAKVPDQVGVLDAFKNFQLVCSFLDSLMVVRLKSNLEKDNYDDYRYCLCREAVS